MNLPIMILLFRFSYLILKNRSPLALGEGLRAFCVWNYALGSTGSMMDAESPVITVGSLPSHFARYSMYLR